MKTKSRFNLRNGLRMTYYHLTKSDQMLASFIMFCLPGIAGLKFGWWFLPAWIIGLLIVVILVRCWDDPDKLGWSD
jgi:hypothetical protein